MARMKHLNHDPPGGCQVNHPPLRSSWESFRLMSSTHPFNPRFFPKEIAFARVLSSILPDSRKFADFHAIFLGESHASAWFSLPTLGKRLHSRKTLHCGDPSGNQKRKLDKHPCPSPTPAPQLLAESAIFFGQTWRR